jgi:hypothetical protein
MRALWIGSGVLIWALHFLALYGITALACARALPQAVPWTVWIATLAAVIAAAAVLRMGYRARASFEGWLTAGVAGLGLIAIVYEALTVAFIPVCA